MRSYQYGYPALGLFGCAITPEREQFISRRLRKVILALDTDLPGKRASWKIYERIKDKLVYALIGIYEDFIESGMSSRNFIL